jgi:glycosyltransferase involved in cell wall biosynthesis
MAKYLGRLGWDVTVVTPHPSVWRHAEDLEEVQANIEREGLQRLLTRHGWRCLVPEVLNYRNQGLRWFAGGFCRRIAGYLGIENGIGWFKATMRACSNLTASDVDVIVATGGPFIAFRLAKHLSDKLGRPYVLDYRDPWTGNPHDARPVRPATIQEELTLLAGCSAVTIVSRSWALSLDQRFSLGSKLHVVTNGYDPEELANLEPYDFGHFAIVYTGKFYPPKRVITPIMAALKSLKATGTEKNGEWYFHYYGHDVNHVREEAERFDVMDRVFMHGSVSRVDVLSAVRGAGVAVVIASVTGEGTQEDTGIVTGKIFEPLGLGTPILLIAPPGSDATEIVEETGRGRRVAGTDIEGITHFFLETMAAKRQAGACTSRYSWPVLASKFDEILKNVLASKAGDRSPQDCFSVKR